jgi:thiazole synthase
VAIQMNLFLNGEPSTAPSGLTLGAFLEHLGLPRKGIVPTSAYDAVRLAEGDRLEIVQFVGGG